MPENESFQYVGGKDLFKPSYTRSIKKKLHQVPTEAECTNLRTAEKVRYMHSNRFIADRFEADFGFDTLGGDVAGAF